MGSRPFLGDSFGRTGNNFYRACAIFPVLYKMASEKTACLWSRGINWAPEATETLLDLLGGGGGTFLVKKSDGPERLPWACVSLLKWLLKWPKSSKT